MLAVIKALVIYVGVCKYDYDFDGNEDDDNDINIKEQPR